ncbi:MAG: DNA polymerase III subunit delta [Peptostreptococcaceae bacterium]|nr:DNA polymerase III subunit delta [Peptostreptococcaceae bacterium]
MLHADLKRRIESGERVFLLFGEEPLLIEREIGKVKELMNPDLALLNQSLIDEKTFSVERLIETLEAVPFMDRFRLVTVRAGEIFKTGSKALRRQEEELLMRYIERPAESTILIFAPKEADKRSSLYKKMKKTVFVWETKRLDRTQLISFCREAAQEEGFSMPEKLWDFLIRRTGYLYKESTRDLDFIYQEIKKLSALSASGEQIGEERIERLFSEEREGDIFRFTDLTVKGKTRDALLMYRDLLGKGQAPLMILGMMSRQFALIGRCHLLLERGYGSSVIAQKLDLHPFAVKKSVELCRWMDFAAAKNLLAACLDTEHRIKTGRIEEEIGVELMIVKAGEAAGRR